MAPPAPSQAPRGARGAGASGARGRAARADARPRGREARAGPEAGGAQGAQSAQGARGAPGTPGRGPRGAPGAPATPGAPSASLLTSTQPAPSPFAPPEPAELATDYLGQIAALQATVSGLQLQIRHDQAQLERLGRLQAAIASLYLEFRDRSAEAAGAPARSQEEEREELLAESPLVVLDRFRASLRVLLAFKEDFEQELRAAVSRQVSEKDTAAKDLAARLAAAQEKIRDLTGQVSSLRRYQDQAGEREAERKSEENSKLAELRAEITGLRATCAQREQELQNVKAIVLERDRLLRERDTRLGYISQLESERQLDKLKFQFEAAKIQTATAHKISGYETEVRKCTKLEADNQALRDRLREAETRVRSYQANMSVRKLEEAERALEGSRQHAAELERQLQALQAGARAKDATIAQLQAHNQTLQQRAIGLAGGGSGGGSGGAGLGDSTGAAGSRGPEDTSALGETGSLVSRTPSRGPGARPPSGRSSARPPSRPGTGGRPRSGGGAGGAEGSAGDSPEPAEGVSQFYLIQSYKDRLKEKDLEIDELAKRVRRLLTLQHRSALAQRSWEEERSKQERQIGALRDEITQLRKSLGSRAGAGLGGGVGGGMGAGMGGTAGPGFGPGPLTASQDLERDLGAPGEVPGAPTTEMVRDVQNLRSFAITTSSAYAQLREAEKGERLLTFRRSDVVLPEEVRSPTLKYLSRPQSAQAGPAPPGALGASGPLGASLGVRRPATAGRNNRGGRGAGYGAATMTGGLGASGAAGAVTFGL